MQKQKPGEILRTFGLLYWAMLLSLVVFIGVSAWFINRQGPALGDNAQAHYIIHTVLIFLLIVIAPVSYLVPQKLIAGIDRVQPLAAKLNAYRLPLLIRFFLLNTAGTLVAAGFILTGTTNLILLQAIIMLFFLVYKPTPFKVANDLQLDEQERQMLMPE